MKLPKNGAAISLTVNGKPIVGEVIAVIGDTLIVTFEYEGQTITKGVPVASLMETSTVEEPGKRWECSKPGFYYLRIGRGERPMAVLHYSKPQKTWHMHNFITDESTAFECDGLETAQKFVEAKLRDSLVDMSAELLNLSAKLK